MICGWLSTIIDSIGVDRFICVGLSNRSFKSNALPTALGELSTWSLLSSFNLSILRDIVPRSFDALYSNESTSSSLSISSFLSNRSSRFFSLSSRAVPC